MKPLGELLADPGLMFLTSTVPAGVPSDFQSSAPVTPSLPEKYRNTATGTLVTVNRAALLLTMPALLLATTRNCLPVSPATVAGVVKVAAVAPPMLDQVLPESVDTCH